MSLHASKGLSLGTLDDRVQIEERQWSAVLEVIQCMMSPSELKVTERTECQEICVQGLPARQRGCEREGRRCSRNISGETKGRVRNLPAGPASSCPAALPKAQQRATKTREWLCRP